MLATYPTVRADPAALSGAVWIDLIDPTESERASVEQAYGLRVPTTDELGEIEATSRLRIENDALYMTAPLIHAPDNGPWLPAPTGFVLTQHILLTVRYTAL